MHPRAHKLVSRIVTQDKGPPYYLFSPLYYSRTLVQLGTDSLAAMRLKEHIRTTFHHDIPAEILLTSTVSVCLIV